MKKRQKIQLKNGIHIPCLRVWCQHCRTVVKTCREIGGGNLKECPHQLLSYRFVGFVPGTKRRIVRSLGMNFTEAVKQAAILKQQLENGAFEAVREKKHIPAVDTPAPSPAETKPKLLTEIFGRYLATLKGEGVPSHLKVIRTNGHINDVKGTFKHFILAVRDAGADPNAFHLADISDAIVGKLHDRLVTRGYSNSYYNRTLGHLMTWATWAEREGYGNAKLFFEKVPRKTITPRPEVISAEEFDKTLSVISYENGWQDGIGKRRARRNHYRNFLVPAFRFALTGRRLEELIMVKFSDVHFDERGRPAIIEFTDYKASRIVRATSGQERKVFSPVTKEIAAFLYAQGLEEKKDTDAYIIAPEIIRNRVANMKGALTRGFSHFWKIAHPNKPIKTFKVLRKVVLTALKAKMRGDITVVSGHSSSGVLRHYIDEKHIAMAQSLKDFSVFGKGNDLEKQRGKSKQKGKEMER